MSDPGPVPVAASLPTYGGWLSAASGYDDALARQKDSGSPVLVYFFTDWCPYCKQFDASVAPMADSKLLRVRVNPETGDRDKQLASTFGVSGYPSIFLIPRAGASPQRVDDGVSREAPPDAQKFVDSCKQTVVNDLWRAGASAVGPATPDLDRALQFDPTNDSILNTRASIRWKAGYRKSALDDSSRACALGNATACKNARGG